MQFEKGEGEAMAMQVAPTPVLEGKNAIRFDRLVKEGLTQKVSFVPTPGINKIREIIANAKPSAKK